MHPLQSQKKSFVFCLLPPCWERKVLESEITSVGFFDEINRKFMLSQILYRPLSRFISLKNRYPLMQCFGRNIFLVIKKLTICISNMQNMSLFSLFFVTVQKVHSKLFLCKKINLKYERLLTLKVQLGFFMQKLLAQRDLTSNKLTLRLILHTCLLQCNMYPLKMSKLNVSHHFNLILNAVQGFVLQSHMQFKHM